MPDRAGPSWSSATGEASPGGRRRGDRDLKNVVVKIGIAIMISFCGFAFSRFRVRFRRSPSPRASSSAGAGTELCGEDSRGCLEDDCRNLKISTDIPSATEVMVGLSPTSTSTDEGECFLLPEFNDFVKQEFEVATEKLEITLITNLREMVLSLQERERNLELQLLDYHVVKEQGAAVQELENRLKINATEAKMYMLKIYSLQAENQKLRAQVEEYSSVMKELEAARTEMKLLEHNLKIDQDQAKEALAVLLQKICFLKQMGQKNADAAALVERKLNRLYNLEGETMELRMINSRLSNEILNLKRELESTQTIASPVETVMEEALEEVNHLRKVNEKLMMEIEQLQTDRCTDVEELVYLKWINACLRYELRNYQPVTGKTVARDLSRSLSPMSEEKVKQLILEYSNLGSDERGLNILETDSEFSSSSQTSTEEPEDRSIDASSSTRYRTSRKAKFISKLKKIMLGKGNWISRISAIDKTSFANSESRGSFSTCSLDDVMRTDSYDSVSFMKDETAAVNLLAELDARTTESKHGKDPTRQINSRLSLDLQSIQKLDLEESREEKDTSIHEKAELKKFAYALRDARGMPKLKRRSSSCRY
ncbi:protein CHUP1, chloroplastic-like isoform X2 [Zingiber officinale]|uniref:protein CHUP1, chloroplastic-like isoform X2 n=1 Tax=Zingiber officinale TaxID=94328 RepID=UPI001C4AF33A|nr:protein CHUP1, chloroplastic-like isoform X2 [Zingiber officinale]